jgi:hypothetical protein
MEEETTEKGPEAPAEPPAPRARKFGCGHMALCGLGLVLLAGGIWYAKLCAARKEFLRHAEALVAEIEAGRPQVPEEENAAELYREAFKLYVSPTDSGAGWEDRDKLSSAVNCVEAQSEVVTKYLKDNEPYLAALCKAVERPSCDFGADLRNFNPTVPLQLMHYARRFLPVAARTEARRGQSGKAMEHLSVMLRLARDSATDDSLAVSRRGSLNTIERAWTAAVELVLADCEPDAAQVAKLLGELDRHCASRGALEPAMRADRAGFLYYYYRPLVSGKEPAMRKVAGAGFSDFMDDLMSCGGHRPFLYAARAGFWQLSGFVIRDARHYEVFTGRYAAAAGKAFPEALDQARLISSEEKRQAGWWAFASDEPLSHFPQAIRGEARALAKLRAAELGLGCRLHRLRFGVYPDKLSDLPTKLPEHFKTLPTDPFSGKTMLYKRTEQGCKVYSVGDNRKDDGGRSWSDRDPQKPDDYDDFIFELKR